MELSQGDYQVQTRISKTLHGRKKDYRIYVRALSPIQGAFSFLLTCPKPNSGQSQFLVEMRIFSRYILIQIDRSTRKSRPSSTAKIILTNSTSERRTSTSE